jgi:hypothetical protein
VAKFLAQNEVKILIDYINNSLNNKIDKNSNEVVSAEQFINELNQYAKKSEVVSALPDNLVYSDELLNYATIE